MSLPNSNRVMALLVIERRCVACTVLGDVSCIELAHANKSPRVRSPRFTWIVSVCSNRPYKNGLLGNMSDAPSLKVFTDACIGLHSTNAFGCFASLLSRGQSINDWNTARGLKQIITKDRAWGKSRARNGVVLQIAGSLRSLLLPFERDTRFIGERFVAITPLFGRCTRRVHPAPSACGSSECNGVP